MVHLSHVKSLFVPFRYPVAIKSPRNQDEREVYVFLEEVKSMLEINTYHENIVNLQGITYKRGRNSESIIEVCPFLYYLS